MKIAIWTTKPPKINWVKRAVETCPYFENIHNIEYITKSVSSDISNMPLDIKEVMRWAKNRANNLVKSQIIADYYVWIEWWTTMIWDDCYIFWCIYILNDKGEWHYGFSAMMQVPKLIEKKLYEDLEELWPIMSVIAEKENIWSKNWSMWAWSDDMFTRTREFEDAFKAAIAPFYNKYYKM